MDKKVVVDCPTCAVRLEAGAVGEVSTGEDESYVLVECPSCHGPLFARVPWYLDEWNNWQRAPAERLWPTPTQVQLSKAIPVAASRDIAEAQKCLSHGIYSAAAVLCGRALERLIKEKSGESTLAKGLHDLRSKVRSHMSPRGHSFFLEYEKISLIVQGQK